jgi:RES domain-containing protein
MCLDTDAPFAETVRHEDLRTEAEVATYTTTIWQIRVDEGAVVDYSTFERADAAGFSAEALVDDDHERCQAEAAWLRSHGINGLLTPSAALPESVNLTLFGPRVAIPWNATVALASTMPADKLTTGHPPAGLVSRVRYYGQSHATLAAYVASHSRRR